MGDTYLIPQCYCQRHFLASLYNKISISVEFLVSDNLADLKIHISDLMARIGARPKSVFTKKHEAYIFVFVIAKKKSLASYCHSFAVNHTVYFCIIKLILKVDIHSNEN